MLSPQSQSTLYSMSCREAGGRLQIEPIWDGFQGFGFVGFSGTPEHKQPETQDPRLAGLGSRAPSL